MSMTPGGWETLWSEKPPGALYGVFWSILRLPSGAATLHALQLFSELIRILITLTLTLTLKVFGNSFPRCKGSLWDYTYTVEVTLTLLIVFGIN